MSILKEIVEKKIIEVNNDKKEKSLLDLKKILKKKNFSFRKQLINFKKKNKTAIIAEVKKASPSKGIFINKFDYLKIATEYMNAGAACLSVLTEKNYFLGNKEYLRQIKKKINLPILCKDFFVDPYQVYEASVIGADCILILLKSTDIKLAKLLYKTALKCGLDSIIEVHNENEMQTALQFKEAIIGINNRNLDTFKTDINTTIKIYKKFNLTNRLIICESGINSNKDIKKITKETGVTNFLIGESLIKSGSIAKKFRQLVL